MKKLEIFETNPNLKEVHMTSDGEAFYNDNDAKMHAKSLKDKTVELVVNPSQLEVITDDEDEDEDFDENVEKIGEDTGKKNTAIEAKADGSVNVLSAEAPKVDAPKADTPKVDAPKVEAPKVDAPKADALKADAPKTSKKGK